MIDAAGLGIAFCAKPNVQAQLNYWSAAELPSLSPTLSLCRRALPSRYIAFSSDFHTVRWNQPLISGPMRRSSLWVVM